MRAIHVYDLFPAFLIPNIRNSHPTPPYHALLFLVIIRVFFFGVEKEVVIKSVQGEIIYYSPIKTSYYVTKAQLEKMSDWYKAWVSDFEVGER